MMRVFFITLALIVCGVAVVVWIGAQPERRYETSACQYRMIHEYKPEHEIGLVTVGGSRMRVSTNAQHFDEILAEIRPGSLPVHNLAHSYFSIGKEYVLIEEFLENHNPKAIVVMIRRRTGDYGTVHRDFVDIARLKDIPLVVHALWPEDRLNAIRAARDVVLKHLVPLRRVQAPHPEMTIRNCDRLDFRLDALALDNGAKKFETLDGVTVDWELSDPRQEGLRRWIAAFKELSNRTGTDIIFLSITATWEPLPEKGLELEFEAETGMPLIVLDRELHRKLVEDGKRDESHMNQAGREIFLPWLVSRIEEKCSRSDGCL
ncbi:hypothetical protein RA28_21420 [Ruegeria sp. ANG-S4]|uniref:hypothetical protein n=1 Tax=Ruegeria sp. ANG-S4 TaxID=1577904 RepID=UPI00057CB2DB|nr:hypothetical protein [Ruegeria sp. ANG-S4]KIC40946.1 hypothetical protein RA28_21420 [Ruegeria sp. ANG-S4]